MWDGIAVEKRVALYGQCDKNEEEQGGGKREEGRAELSVLSTPAVPVLPRLRREEQRFVASQLCTE